MNTALTSTTALISRIDGSETPAPGRWNVAPGHTWLVLRSPGRLAGAASAFGAAVSGTVDIDALPEHSRISLSVDRSRLACDRPAMARALADRNLRIDAIRTGRFAIGGWDIAGSVAAGDEAFAFDAWIDYHGVYRRRREIAYAWFTMSMTVPAAVLGMSAGSIRRRRHIVMNIDLLATADESASTGLGGKWTLL